MPTFTKQSTVKNLIEEAFHSLTQTTSPYVVLEGYEKLPIDYPGRLQVLAVDVDTVVRVMGLRRLYPKQPVFGFAQQASGGKSLEIAIRKKGSGYLPESFESEILGRSVVKNKFVRVPGIEEEFWYRMYRVLYFTDQIRGREDRRHLSEYMSRRVGPARAPKAHPDITFYSANHIFRVDE